MNARDELRDLERSSYGGSFKQQVIRVLRALVDDSYPAVMPPSKPGSAIKFTSGCVRVLGDDGLWYSHLRGISAAIDAESVSRHQFEVLYDAGAPR